TVLALVVVVFFSVLSLKMSPETSFWPNKYTSKVELLINESPASYNIVSMLSSGGLDGMASIANAFFPLDDTNYSALAMHVLKSNTFFDTVYEKFNLKERYKNKTSPKGTSRKALKENIRVHLNDNTDVLAISFTDIDPVFAQAIVNYAVSYIQERFSNMELDKKQRQKENLDKNIAGIYNQIISLEEESARNKKAETEAYTTNGFSLVLAASRIERELSVQEVVYTELVKQKEFLIMNMSSEIPMFKVLEYAEVPSQKSGPARGKLCIIVTVAAFFLSVFLAFLLHGLTNIKKDPVAMAKLQGEK
ncbi:MAG TPA: lipopolysaccharide biosynthesis protein, partial [Treponemataceae bacterium]|nr:lipopolysaccharide biosynthesis protein [Treponemataceae bacterium]